MQGQVSPQWLVSETKWCNQRPPGPNKRPGDTRKPWWRTVSPATATGRVPSGASWRAGARWGGTTPSSSSQSAGSHNLSETNRTSVLLASFSSREDGKTGTSGRAEKTPENKKTCDHSTIATWTMKKPCNLWTWNQADNFYACVVTSLRHKKTINTVHPCEKRAQDISIVAAEFGETLKKCCEKNRHKNIVPTFIWLNTVINSNLSRNFSHWRVQWFQYQFS